MKVVKQISTGKIVYRESPDFKDGQGIINAHINENIPVMDLQEVDIPQQDWDVFQNNQSVLQETNNKTLDNFSLREKVIVKGLLKLINQLRVKVGMAEITLVQVKQFLIHETGDTN
jgi:hypothetical protein